MHTSEKRKIFGLQSHDCHILMQQLLLLAIHGVLHKNVCAIIVELCSFFKQLCSKVLKTDQLEHLQTDIIATFCKLERIFPPSFFHIVHETNLLCYGLTGIYAH